MTKYEGMMAAGRALTKGRKVLALLFMVSLFVVIWFATPFFIMRGTALTIVSLTVAFLAVVVRWRAYSVAERSVEKLSQAKGIYSTVRFPIYLSDLLMITALALYGGVWSYIVCVVPVSYCAISRMVLWEEGVMRNQEEELFKEWAARTAALIPIRKRRVNKSTNDNYEKAEKTTLKVRFRAMMPIMMAVLFMFTAIGILKNYMINLAFEFNVVLLAILGVTFVLCLLFTGFSARR